MTHEQFIALETARLAKQAGFDWECWAYWLSDYANGELEQKTPFENRAVPYDYNNEPGARYRKGDMFSAPTQSVLQRWLREEKEIIVEPIYDLYDHCFYCRFANNKSKNWQYIVNRYDDGEVYIKLCFNTYEAALEAGLQKCLTLLISEQMS